MVILLKFSCLFFSSVAFTARDPLWVPTVTVPKAMLLGDTNSAESAWAGFASANPTRRKRLKQKTENAKRDDFGRDIVDPPELRAATHVYENAQHNCPKTGSKNAPKVPPPTQCAERR